MIYHSESSLLAWRFVEIKNHIEVTHDKGHATQPFDVTWNDSRQGRERLPSCLLMKSFMHIMYINIRTY